MKSIPFHRYGQGPPPEPTETGGAVPPGVPVKIPPEVRLLLGRPVRTMAQSTPVPRAVPSAEPTKDGPVRWSYGVTTCPQRVTDGLLARTLASLAAAGWERPRVFLDGTLPVGADVPGLGGLEVVERGERVKPYLNWILAVTELYYRHPCADRFAVFQDDVVFCRGLREYLERSAWPGPSPGYLNLYSAPSNEDVAPSGHTGWYESKVLSQHPHAAHRELRLQSGQGALALVFDRGGVETLLASRHLTARLVTEPGPGNRLADRVPSPTGWRSLDGAVVTALNYAGYREYVHAPGLVQHAGTVSTVDKVAGSDGSRADFTPHRWTADRISRTFPGETWDATQLLT